MKKRTAAVICIIMLFSLSACNKNMDTATEDRMVSEAENKEIEKNSTQKKYIFDPIYLDEFVFEDACYEEFNGNISIYLKFRNISEKRVDNVAFWVQFIDYNGDVIILQNEICSMDNVDKGQAGWAQFSCLSTDGYNTMENLVDKAKSIKIYNYQIAENIDGALKTSFREPLDIPAVIDLADIPRKTNK